MCCAYAHAQLPILLKATRWIAQPTSLKTWRSRFDSRHAPNCRTNAALRQLSTKAPSRSPRKTSKALSKKELQKLLAPEPVTNFAQARQSRQCSSICVLGIDPDIGGAVAVMEWNMPSDSSQLELQDAKIELHDMPLVTAAIGKRLQRQIDPLAISKLVSSLDLSPSTEIRAILEHPVPNALNGKWSWFSAGYNSGIWKGILASFGVPFETVPASVWKTDMELRKSGKEGSRQLAQELLPQTLPQLKRKKDHGRAEALLLAAWGIGVRRSSAASVQTDEILEDSVDELDEAELSETLQPCV